MKAEEPRREERSFARAQALGKGLKDFSRALAFGEVKEKEGPVEMGQEEMGEATEPMKAYEGGMELASRFETMSPASPLVGSSNFGPYDGQELQDSEAAAPGKNSFDTTGTLPQRSTDFIEGTGTLEKTGPETLSVPEKRDAFVNLHGLGLGKCGGFLLQHLLEVLPLRSQCMGRRDKYSLYPLPTSRELLSLQFPELDGDEMSWMICVVVGLNSLWGGLLFCEDEPNKVQSECLGLVCKHVKRFCCLDATVEAIDWSQFFSVKSVDYKGDEVRVARRFTWSNIVAALPAEIGRVPLAEVCNKGCLDYVLNFDSFLRPMSEWKLGKAPRVMVEDQHWAEVCQGLVQSGICRFVEESEVFHVEGRPLLNGMFGVTKDDWTPEGVEIYRLIMNLIPLNGLCLPLAGDVGTLPAWSSMSPFFLQPNENLLISSEDVKCFFYTMSVPDCWVKYLAFNKPVPPEALPPHLQGRQVYVASQVLPMGFLNSVSLAQHVHRNLVKMSEADSAGDNAPDNELRKDLPFPVSNPNWRVYLDNYDLLERVRSILRWWGWSIPWQQVLWHCDRPMKCGRFLAT